MGGPVLGPRFEAAMAYAAQVHAAQVRKGTETPYVAHLLAVAGLVIEDGARARALDEDEVIAALLHDAAEDQGGAARLADIRGRFGDRVAAIVRACSDSLVEHGPKPPWRERKEAHLAHLEGVDAGVLRVAAADKLHNMRAILADHREVGDALWRRFNRDADPLWYFGELARLLARRAAGPMADELGRLVEELRGRLEGAVAPVPGARWERPGRLLAGAHPARAGGDPAAVVEGLREAGVGLVVDLTGEADALPGYDGLLGDGIERLNVPVASGGRPGPAQLEEILGAVDAALDAGRAVYVHCQRGGGRTRAVVEAHMDRLLGRRPPGAPGEPPA